VSDWQKHWRERHPEKFASPAGIFARVHRGDRIFIGTACGEPQQLVRMLIDYVGSHPRAVYDAEILHVWTLGVAPYTDPKFKRNFRHNSFFVGSNTRAAVNEGLADYTPISLSQIADLLRRGVVPVDVALIQVSPPDEHGFMSLGISVDIVKPAVDQARMIIAQVNPRMPRVHGDTFVNIARVDFVVPYDEPLLEYHSDAPDEVVQRIGQYVARMVHDGDTIQVGYGSIPDAILTNLREKRHLGIHTELLGDGLADLIERRVVDNSRKSIDPGKSVAAFCMGSAETYRFLDDNPGIAFRPTEYTNDPRVIAQQRNMTAINSALEIDLTGQASAESLGTTFYSGIGGQADFMRGAALAPGGKTVLALPSTAADGRVSRIVPLLQQGAGVTLTRTDVRYVVTEYGIAYVHGRNIRDRAMALIAIAHPRFRRELIEEAKRLRLIYPDQAYIPGAAGQYPEELEAHRTTRKGLELLLRPVRISDEPLLQDFFRGLSDESMHQRFMSIRTDMPHERLQKFTVVDYSRDMVILATLEKEDGEEVIGVGQYALEGDVHRAEVGLAVRDEYQDRGVGRELLAHLTRIAKQRGLLGFTARVLIENQPMLHLFETSGFSLSRESSAGVVTLHVRFTPPGEAVR
jgi:acyl-CoA hydrolase/GNAT superfamily N-acetyltransferase